MSRVDELLEAIGQSAVDASDDDREGRLLVYAESKDGVVSAELFYETHEGRVRYRYCADAIVELVYELWEAAQTSGRAPWRTMTYLIDGDEFTVDFARAGEVDEREGVTDRRPRVLARIFGDADFDYSSPE